MTASTSTTTVLTTLQSAGLVLTLTTERGLGVTPKAKLTEPLRALIKAHRDELLQWVSKEASNDPASPKAPEPQPAPAVVSKVVSKKTADWKDLDRAYQTHHITCPTCIAAGKGYGLRCGTGAALCAAYDAVDMPKHQKVAHLPPQAKADIHPSLLTAANRVEIDTMVARLALFDTRGLNVNDAERLADKLLVRDREGDHRGACAECRRMQGSGPGRWKCGDRAPVQSNELAGANLGEAYVHLNLHHCLSLEKAR